MTEPLHREDLDMRACDCGQDHGPMYFHSGCHRDVPTWAKYERGGTLTILCAECDAEIVRLAIARRPPSSPRSRQEGQA